MIFASGWYICLAQRSATSDYASGLVFGYSVDKIFFQRKAAGGTWQTVKEV